MNGDTNSEISGLRTQVRVLLAALIVVSGTLTVYLYMQSRVLGRELETNQRLVNNFNQGQPAVTTLINQLGAYSMTHPEIRPMLAKYGIVPAPAQPVPAQRGTGGVTNPAPTPKR